MFHAVSFGVSVATCTPITSGVAEAPHAQIVASSSGDFPTSPMNFGPYG